MELPRIVVSLDRRPGGGWTVDVRPDHAPHPLVAPFEIDAVEIAPEGIALQLPVVPDGRRPAQAEPHASLCAGDTNELTSLLGILARREATKDEGKLYGRWLFECLMAPVWAEVRASQDVLAARGVELALMWPADDTHLHRHLWEAMHDGRAPLAGHPDLLVAITRLVPVDVDPPTAIVRLPHVLFAAGARLTDEVIRPGAMFMGLLRVFDAEGRCLSRARDSVSIERLTEECRQFQPDVVHLVAHGALRPDGTPFVELSDERGTVEEADAGALATALQAGGRPLVVVLSACNTGTAAGPGGASPLAAEVVARARIPVVVAMAGEVSERACRLFTRRLVQAIHDGESVVVAAANGRRAALTSSSPEPQLDWAMPAVFMAQNVASGFQAIDPTQAKSIAELAKQLKLRQPPVFIGRSDILGLVDDVFHEDATKRLGFVAICRESSITGLGGTRLLREIGFRLLRQGHVPLFLGPYQQGSGPSSLRQVITDILVRALTFAEKLDVAPSALEVFQADPAFVGRAGDATERALAGKSVDAVLDTLFEIVSEFQSGSGALKPKIVRRRLERDMNCMAIAATRSGEPFGEHTRVVLLCDQLHTWAGSIDDFLAMVEPSGLGSAKFPVPIITTGSHVLEAGQTLKVFGDLNRMPGFAYPELAELSQLEAVLGFQWVLLHQWPDESAALRKVYTVSPTSARELLEKTLGTLKGIPTAVTEKLYDLAEVSSILNLFVEGDDEAAFKTYRETFG